MSGFASLNLANTALRANQRALEVTGQNIANANTEGYTRQRVDLTAGSTAQTFTFYARNDAIGNGVNSDTVVRIRDAFLERRGLQEHGSSARAEAVSASFDQLETTFGEPGQQGIQSLLSKAATAWSALSGNPTSEANRTAVLEANRSLATSLNTVAGAINAQWSNTRAQAADGITDVNASLRQVADLNSAIRSATLQGFGANELKDQRDLLVGKLAVSLGATTVDGEEGMVDVVVGNTALVSGRSSSTLALGGGAAPAAMGTTPVTLVVVPGTNPIAVGGSVGGQLAAMNTVIPSYRNGLDSVAATLVTSVNAAVTGGFDQDGNAGSALFTGTSAATIGVALTNPRSLAVAADAPSAGDPSADGRIADTIASLGKTAGSAESGYRSMITRLGVEAGSATSAVRAATAIVSKVDLARQSVSGVSLDEEMTNLMVFQQSYSAAARLVTAIDEMLDVLINKTGLVGR